MTKLFPFQNSKKISISNSKFFFFTFKYVYRLNVSAKAIRYTHGQKLASVRNKDKHSFFKIPPCYLILYTRKIQQSSMDRKRTFCIKFGHLCLQNAQFLLFFSNGFLPKLGGFCLLFENGSNSIEYL